MNHMQTLTLLGGTATIHKTLWDHVTPLLYLPPKFHANGIYPRSGLDAYNKATRGAEVCTTSMQTSNLLEIQQQNECLA